MPSIDIYVAETRTKISSSQALGFYGDDGFGDPIALGSYNGRTFLTNSAGTSRGIECDNCKFTNADPWTGVGGVSGVIVGQTGDGIDLLALPNYQATINVRFTNASDVRTQNAFILVHDGGEINAPTGLSVYGAEIVHSGVVQDNTGIGDNVWLLMAGSGNELGLVESPGTSGLNPDGPATISKRHDFYVAMSVAPTTPSNKNFFFTTTLEYI